MRIAFVGKGGSGKTTASTLFAQYQSTQQPTVAFDADINMHMAELLTGSRPKTADLLSEKAPSEAIRTYLRGTNPRIKTNAHFKKSTPPGSGSNLIDITTDNWLCRQYGQVINPNLTLMTVGSYSEDGIASSCYHNNLSILENILTHTTDNGTIVADMVAGTDAFASTLFSQFDMLVFVVEPTKRSLTVLEQYYRLAQHSGVSDRLFVIANKAEDEADLDFIQQHSPVSILGSISRSAHLLKVDKGQETIAFEKLYPSDQQVFKTISQTLSNQTTTMNQRLSQLWELHKTYVSQSHIKDRFGDLTTQIDSEFQYPQE